MAAACVFLLVLTLTHAGPGEGLLGAAKAQLPADDAGRQQVPAVVANRPPLAAFQHLHPPLAEPGAPLQPHISLEGRQRHGSDGGTSSDPPIEMSLFSSRQTDRSLQFLLQAAAAHEGGPRHAADHSGRAPLAGQRGVGLPELQGAGRQVDLRARARHGVNEEGVLLTRQEQPERSQKAVPERFAIFQPCCCGCEELTALNYVDST